MILCQLRLVWWEMSAMFGCCSAKRHRLRAKARTAGGGAEQLYETVAGCIFAASRLAAARRLVVGGLTNWHCCSVADCCVMSAPALCALLYFEGRFACLIFQHVPICSR